VEPIPESVEAMAERDAVVEDDGLMERLRSISEQVQELVPDCIGMTVAILQDQLVLTLVATEAEIALLDSMQYLADGPCLEAVREQNLVELDTDEVLDEEKWRIFALASAASAVASTLTMPIVTDGQVVGSVNLYAGSGHAFTDVHEQLALLLGAWAPGAVENADLSFSTRRLAEQAPLRLRDQARFETAVGLHAAREHLSLEDAQRRLISAAERAGVSLSRIVEAVIDYYSR
jgi:GAF domain-containing protein